MSGQGQDFSNRGDVNEDDLHAYVDGQLSASRKAVVEAHLRSHPEHAKMVAHWRRQNELLRALHANVMNEEIPDRLRPSRLHGRRRPSSRAWPGWQALAASVLIAALAGAGGWYARDAVAPALKIEGALADHALAAHATYAVEVRHPVEVAAGEEAHLVGWLSKRLGKKIIAPDLSASGFRLMGGRLLPSSEGPAAQLMYEDRTGRRITCYIARGREPQLAAFRFKSRGKFRSFYWQDQSLSYAIVGDVSRDELKKLAFQVHGQIG